MQPLNDNVDIFVYTHKPFRQIVSNSIYKVLTCSRDDFSGFTVHSRIKIMLVLLFICHIQRNIIFFIGFADSVCTKIKS